MIEGGWDFVAAAYAFTYATLFAYSVHVWRRARAESAAGATASVEPSRPSEAPR